MSNIKSQEQEQEQKLLKIIKEITQNQYTETLKKWDSTHKIQDKLNFIFNLVHNLEKTDQKEKNKSRAKYLKRSWNRYARSIANSNEKLDERDIIIHNINNFRRHDNKNNSIQLHQQFNYFTQEQIKKDIKEYKNDPNKEQEYNELKSIYNFLFGTRETIKDLKDTKQKLEEQKTQRKKLTKKIRNYKKLYETSQAKDVKKNLDKLIKQKKDIKLLEEISQDEIIEKTELDKLQNNEYIKRSIKKRKSSKIKKRLTPSAYIPTLITPWSEASINAYFLRNGALSKKLLSSGSCLTLNTALFGCATKPVVKEIFGADHYFQLNNNTNNQTQPTISAKKQLNFTKGITPAQLLIIAGLEVSTLLSFLGLTIAATSALFPPAAVVIAATCTAIAVSMLVYPDLKEAVKGITISNIKKIPSKIYDEYSKKLENWKRQQTIKDKLKFLSWQFYITLAYTSAVAISLAAGAAYTILYKGSLPSGLNAMFSTFGLTMNMAKNLSIGFAITSAIAWTPFNIQTLKSCLVELPGKIGKNIYKNLPSRKDLSFYSVATAIPKVTLGVIIFSTIGAMTVFNAIGQAGGIAKGISFLSIGILKIALGISCAASNFISPVNQITDYKTIKQASKESEIQNIVTNFIKPDIEGNTQSHADPTLSRQA